MLLILVTATLTFNVAASSKLLIFLIMFYCTESYADQSRYNLEFINESSLLKKEKVFFETAFSDDYLVKEQIKIVKSVATSRIEDLVRVYVKEAKDLLAKNPLFLIDWPNDKNLIFKNIKKIEKEKRKS